MRTDKMMAMINSDSESLAAFKRARGYKASRCFVDRVLALVCSL